MQRESKLLKRSLTDYVVGPLKGRRYPRVKSTMQESAASAKPLAQSIPNQLQPTTDDRCLSKNTETSV